MGRRRNSRGSGKVSGLTSGFMVDVFVLQDQGGKQEPKKPRHTISSSTVSW